MTELLIFYGGLSLAVGLGVGYSLALYQRNTRQRGKTIRTKHG